MFKSLDRAIAMGIRHAAPKNTPRFEYPVDFVYFFVWECKVFKGVLH